MSDTSNEKYLYAIIRKPQEGKTFICLENIKQSNDTIHLIITMNTIKSNCQFYERARSVLNARVCIFNSKNNTDKNILHHAKDIIQVKNKIIQDGIHNIIMCAHDKRFRESIIELIELLQHDNRIYDKYEIVVHIDEAHAYVPIYRHETITINNFDIVNRIYLYSATPVNIWVDNREAEDSIFKLIYVVDVEEQFGIITSENYFGVKNCIHEQIQLPEAYKKAHMVATKIPIEFINKYGNDKQKLNPDIIKWYGKKYIFAHGDEQLYLTYIAYILNTIKGHYINDNIFSYNFIPAYTRKLTHYAAMETILAIYKTAIVIIINGDGTKGYLLESFTNKPQEEVLEDNNEPSKQIELFITKYPNRPVFITGFHCVGMSVTFINETIGNFDNVIFSHTQFNNRPDVLYQLCRFLFNYTQWTTNSNIKKTKLITNTEVYNTCLKYESQIDEINQKSGALLTKNEIIGNITYKVPKIPKERKIDLLQKYSSVEKIKCIQVSNDENYENDENGENGENDENGEKQLQKVINIYEDWTGNKITNKSIPTKNNAGFYECSTTSEKKVHYNVSTLKITIRKWKWESNFLLRRNKYKYCRIYVAYDDETDNTEYTWIIRRMQLTNNPEVNRLLESLV